MFVDETANGKAFTSLHFIFCQRFIEPISRNKIDDLQYILLNTIHTIFNEYNSRFDNYDHCSFTNFQLNNNMIIVEISTHSSIGIRELIEFLKDRINRYIVVNLTEIFEPINNKVFIKDSILLTKRFFSISDIEKVLTVLFAKNDKEFTYGEKEINEYLLETRQSFKPLDLSDKSEDSAINIRYYMIFPYSNFKELFDRRTYGIFIDSIRKFFNEGKAKEKYHLLKEPLIFKEFLILHIQSTTLAQPSTIVNSIKSSISIRFFHKEFNLKLNEDIKKKEAIYGDGIWSPDYIILSDGIKINEMVKHYLLNSEGNLTLL